MHGNVHGGCVRGRFRVQSDAGGGPVLLGSCGKFHRICSSCEGLLSQAAGGDITDTDNSRVVDLSKDVVDMKLSRKLWAVNAGGKNFSVWMAFGEGIACRKAVTKANEKPKLEVSYGMNHT